jgi:predicted TPR repeat methyltransferase
VDALPDFDLRAFYDDYPRIEDQLETALDESLAPRGPELLFDVVRGMGLPAGSRVVDVGCGEGDHALRLATDLEFSVLGSATRTATAIDSGTPPLTSSWAIACGTCTG